MTAFCFFGVRHVTHVQTSGETDERSFFECDEIHATTKRDEATVSARLGRAGLAGALSRIHGVGVRDRGDAAGSRARSRRSRRAPAAPDSAKSPRRSSRRRRIFERSASSGRAREAVSRDVPGCRRGRNRPGTWSQPCRDRGRCPAGRRRCPRPCPSSGTSGPSRRCPCRAGRGWRRAGGARRGRPRRPETMERVRVRGERVSAEAWGSRETRASLAQGAATPRRCRDSRHLFLASASESRVRPGRVRARSPPARTLATGTAMVLMVTADMMSFCCER